MLGLIVVLMMSVVGFYLWQQRQRAVPDAIDLGLKNIARRVSTRLDFRLPELVDEHFFLDMSSDATAAAANGWDGNESAVVRARFADAKAFKQMRQNELVAVERATNTRVGTATMSASSEAFPDTRSVGIHVHRDHRNQGYGREIMAMALLTLHSTPGPIAVGTRVTNLGMQRVMAQLGYEAQPDTIAFVARNGETYESYWYWCGTDVHPPQGLLGE